MQSLTIAPLSVVETGCTPKQAPASGSGRSTWGTFARNCRGEIEGTCPNSGLHCSPRLEPGFLVCVFQKGDNDCSAPGLAPYTEKHLFYSGINDTRSCSPCSCGAPSGGRCTAEISVYADALCASVPSYMVTIDSSTAACTDVISASALVSKVASPPLYAAGSCTPSGGDPLGSAEPIGPSTFCCIPLQVGPPPG